MKTIGVFFIVGQGHNRDDISDRQRCIYACPAAEWHGAVPAVINDKFMTQSASAGRRTPAEISIWRGVASRRVGSSSRATYASVTTTIRLREDTTTVSLPFDAGTDTCSSAVSDCLRITVMLRGGSSSELRWLRSQKTQNKTLNQTLTLKPWR